MSNQQVVLLKKPGPSYPEVNDVFETRPVEVPREA